LKSKHNSKLILFLRNSLPV